MQAFIHSFLIGLAWYWLIPLVDVAWIVYFNNTLTRKLQYTIDQRGRTTVIIIIKHAWVLTPKALYHRERSVQLMIESARSAAQVQGSLRHAVAVRVFTSPSPRHEATFLLPPELSFFLPAAGKRNQHHRAHVLPSALLMRRTWF